MSARLAWWGTAWLQGRIAPDGFLDAVLGVAMLVVYRVWRGLYHVPRPAQPAGYAGYPLRPDW